MPLPRIIYSAGGWSAGTFGAIGEFMRDEAEPFRRTRNGVSQEVVTARQHASLTER